MYLIYTEFTIYKVRAVRAITNSEYRAHTAPLVSKLEIVDIFQVNTLDTFKFVSLPQ